MFAASGTVNFCEIEGSVTSGDDMKKLLAVVRCIGVDLQERVPELHRPDIYTKSVRFSREEPLPFNCLQDGRMQPSASGTCARLQWFVMALRGGQHADGVDEHP